MPLRLKSCSPPRPIHYVGYGAATMGKAILKGISDAYNEPRDNRELGIRVGAEVGQLACDLAKLFIKSNLCEPFPELNNTRMANSAPHYVLTASDYGLVADN